MTNTEFCRMVLEKQALRVSFMKLFPGFLNLLSHMIGFKDLMVLFPAIKLVPEFGA